MPGCIRYCGGGGASKEGANIDQRALMKQELSVVELSGAAGRRRAEIDPKAQNGGARCGGGGNVTAWTIRAPASTHRASDGRARRGAGRRW